MYCTCTSKTSIKDTRETPQGTWRRHQCKSATCGKIFTTIEQVCETIPGEVGGFRGNPSHARPTKRTALIPAMPEIRAPKKRLPAKRLNYGDDTETKPARMRIEEMREARELERY